MLRSLRDPLVLQLAVISTLAIGSLLLTCASFALIAVARTPVAMITGYLVLNLVWPAVTLSTCLVLTEIVAVRMVAVAMAAVNTLSQLGAFAVPSLWGISKDATGSYALGLTLVPVAFAVATGLAIILRRKVRGKDVALGAVAVA